MNTARVDTGVRAEELTEITLDATHWLRTAKAILAQLALWRQRFVQRRALAEIDEHLLDDIGLTRAQALAEAGRPFWRP